MTKNIIDNSGSPIPHLFLSPFCHNQSRNADIQMNRFTLFEALLWEHLGHIVIIVIIRHRTNSIEIYARGQ